jgi:PAS domain-containing protein
VIATFLHPFHYQKALIRRKTAGARHRRIIAQPLTEKLKGEQRFRAVVEAVPSAILVVDDKGMIKLANSKAKSVFGYPRA